MAKTKLWTALSLLAVLLCNADGFLQQSASVFRTNSLERTISRTIETSSASAITVIQSIPTTLGIQSHRFRSPTALSDNKSGDEYNITEDDRDDDVCKEQDLELVADFRGRPAGVVMEDLNWRVHKLRLEEANTRRFLKAGPRFLPYEECRKWVQAWGNRWQSASEWENWIAAGEKRNSYIPSRPEEYFTRRGEWISWDHFLGVESSVEDVTDSDDQR
ncbi:hypothetical protein IV203_031189 [Nitzschia inconspicua]|uniref:Uncharacterized protein n=1 Tax=Nitzschia inconspicua TaxID=303405 RepID=A0A9K3LXJ5_9STRA|nr:hypothetical protein IV203_031189 [Nitzschia inconspicua]